MSWRRCGPSWGTRSLGGQGGCIQSDLIKSGRVRDIQKVYTQIFVEQEEHVNNENVGEDQARDEKSLSHDDSMLIIEHSFYITRHKVSIKN